MADNVVNFTGISKLDVPPDRILSAAMGQLQGVILIGYDKDEQEYFATSYADGGEALWLVERFKAALMRVADELEGGDDGA